jgi:xylose isomerase
MARELAELLSTCRADLGREAATQADVHAFLAARLPAGTPIQREVRLSDYDRIDFLVGFRVGIEVKLNTGRQGEMIAQLARYARHDRIGALILLTNKAIDLVPMIGGKPVFAVSLGRAWI